MWEAEVCDKKKSLEGRSRINKNVGRGVSKKLVEMVGSNNKNM